MGTITNSLTHNNVNSRQQPDPKSPEQYPSDLSKITGTVTNHFLDQAVNYSSYYFGSGC
jgi:hypothetical protein